MLVTLVVLCASDIDEWADILNYDASNFRQPPFNKEPKQTEHSSCCL